MDIYELDSYRLSDAVKFHTELNPALWDGKNMRPEVREALLQIADDFKTFMGIDDLAIEDITVSGSNAAFSYTPHSDIDLHLLVDFSRLNPDDVYQELFNAKKYQYNDQHDIKIRGYDVELYVQDSNKPVRSLGEYSIVNNDWNRIPVQRRGNLDEKSTKAKYEKLKDLIELALSTDDLDRVSHITDTLKKYRQAGLDQHGEFGPENLAYKMLRTQGLIQKIFDHKAKLEDSRLSLDERRKKKKKKKTFKYGAFGGAFFPGYGYYGQSGEASDGGGGDGGGGGESIRESTESQQDIIERFAQSCADLLGIENVPKIKLRRDPQWTKINGTFGRYTADPYNRIELATHDRHIVDILRTLAHEMTHAHQNEVTGLPDNAGETGSRWEDEANAMAGRIMRHWAESEPHLFQGVELEEGRREKAAGVAASACITDEDYSPDEPPGPESKPTMPAGTLKVDVSDVYDWYKIGQHISNMKGLGKHDFGQGPPSAIISFGDEDTEHKFIQDLEATGLDVTDIDPADPKKRPGKKIKTDPTYNVDETIATPVSKDEKANQDYYKFVRGKQQLGRPLTKAEMQFLSKYQLTQHLKKQVAEQELEEGIGKALGTAAVAGAMALGSPAAKSQDAGRVAYQIGKQIYQPSGIFTRAGAEEELKGMARDLARGQEIRVGGKRIFGSPQAQGERVAANGVGATPEQAFQDALTRAYEDANRRYGPISIGDWRPVNNEKEIQRVGGQYQAAVVIQGPAPVREGASGYIPTKKQARDPRFKTALTVDIRPGQLGKEANKLGLQTDSQGRPDLLMKNLANALKEYKETGEFEPINEVRMNTGTLEAWARSPEAEGIRAGFEAELIFRDTKRDEDEGEMEPDYDYDERADNIDHVIDFFSNDDWGFGIGSRTARDLREELFSEFVEWADEQISESWDENAEDQTRDYMETNVWDDDEEREKRIQNKIDELFPDDDAEAILQAGEAAPRFTKSSDQTEYAKQNELYAKYKEASDAASEEFEAEVASEVENQGEYYDQAREYYFEMMRDSGDYDERDFLRDRYGYMSDIASSNSLDWPYWTGGGSSGGSRDWEEIGDSLRRAVDMEVKVSGNYHSTTRKEGRWIIEPDGSLDPDDGDDMGLEIVSPPMPLLETIDKLKAVIDWAQNEADAYTNQSTGLHMGVSIPYVGGDVDYVKLVLFMGDEYVLDKFGRAGNTYAASAMKKLRQNMAGARNRGELTEAKLDPMGALELVQKNLIELAARYVQQGVGTSKYTSAHIQDGYIEFRSPGGDYLSMESRGEWDDIKDTMLRFARAMYIAGRPDLERREYAKKLYKLISPGAQDDGLKLFSEYSAGTIGKEQLKKQWADTVLQKEIPNTGKQEFEVYDANKSRSPDGVIDTFYARNYDDAYDAYTKKWSNDPRWRHLDVRLKQPWFDVFDPDDNVVATFRASDIDQAMDKAKSDHDEWTDDWNVYRRPDGTPEPEQKLSARAQVAKRIKEPKVTPAVAADNAQDSKELKARVGELSPASYTGRWEVLNPSGELIRHVQGNINDAENARRQVMFRYENPADVTVRPAPVPQATGTGRYEVVDRRNNSVMLQYTAASDSDAQNKFNNWLRNQGMPQDTENYGWRIARQSSVQDVGIDVAQNFQQPEQIFTGNWQVLDSDTNDVLYTFSGVGNNQADANRVAARWLQQNAPQEADMTDVTVVPVMR
jgi:hypothetical protein